jgi:hypothetical protein
LCLSQDGWEAGYLKGYEIGFAAGKKSCGPDYEIEVPHDIEVPYHDKYDGYGKDYYGRDYYGKDNYKYGDNNGGGYENSYPSYYDYRGGGHKDSYSKSD